MTAVISTFVSRTSAGTLLNPSRYTGANVIPTTSTSSIALEFSQNRPNGQMVTLLSNSSQTTQSQSITTGMNVFFTEAATTIVSDTTTD